MSSADDIKKLLRDQYDDIDKILDSLMEIKRRYRAPGTQVAFKKDGKKEINRFLQTIKDETKIPKS